MEPGYEFTLRRLESLSRSPFPALRVHAAQQLTQRPRSDAQPLLMLLLSDNDVTVLRAAAVAARHQIRDARVAEQMRKLSTHVDSAVSAAARAAIGGNPSRPSARLAAPTASPAAETLSANDVLREDDDSPTVGRWWIQGISAAALTALLVWSNPSASRAPTAVESPAPSVAVVASPVPVATVAPAAPVLAPAPVVPTVSAAASAAPLVVKPAPTPAATSAPPAQTRAAPAKPDIIPITSAVVVSASASPAPEEPAEEASAPAPSPKPRAKGSAPAWMTVQKPKELTDIYLTLAQDRLIKEDWAKARYFAQRVLALSPRNPRAKSILEAANEGLSPDGPSHAATPAEQTQSDQTQNEQ